MALNLTSFDDHLLQLIRNKNNLDEIKSIIEKKNLYNATDYNRNTLLHLAAKHGNVQVVQLLINSASKVDAQNNLGETPLMLAITNKFDVETIEVLIESGANIFLSKTNDDTAIDMILESKDRLRKGNRSTFLNLLLAGCLNDKKELVSMLYDADWLLDKVVELRDPELTKLMFEREHERGSESFFLEWNPLHVAVKNIDVENVRLLHEHGYTDINFYTVRSPLSYVYDENSNDNYDDVDYGIDDDDDIPKHSEERIEILKMLLERAEKSEYLSRQTKNILKRGNEEAIKLLFQSKINPLLESDFRHHAINYLVQNKNPGVIEQLKKYSFNVNATDDIGETYLMSAARANNLTAIDFLLEEGALVNYANKDGVTALYDAVDEKSKREERTRDCVQILLENGANVQIKTTCTITPTIFDTILHGKTAHLVLQNAQGTPIIQLIQSRVESNERFKEIFESSKQQLNMLIYPSITLFDLLTLSDNKLERYVRNEELVSKIQDFISNSSNNYYFCNALKKRVSEAKDVVLLKHNAARVLSKIMETNYERFPLIVDNIFSYLDLDDLENLIKAL